MADIKKTIEIVFGAVDNTGSGLSSVGDGLSNLSSGIGNITEPLAGLADKVLAVDGAILAIGTTMTYFAVKEAAEFKTAFNEISTLFQASEKDYAAFEKNIVDYATTSTQSIEEINGAVYSAISAGTKYSDSLALLSKAEKLSVAGKSDLQSTTVTLASTMNAYAASTSEAEKYSDILFTTVKEGQTTIPELAQSLAQVSSIAAASGVGFDEVGAAIATLTAAGQPTAQAMTSLKGVINGLISPSKDSADAFASLGIKIGASEIQSRGFATIMGEIAGKTEGNTDLLKRLFPALEGFGGAAVLAGTNTEKFNSSLAAMRASLGATDGAFDKMQENLNLVAQRLENNVKTAFIAFGNELLPQSTKAVSAAADVFKSLTFTINETDAFKPILTALNNLGVDVENALAGIASALPQALNLIDFTGLIEAWGGVGETLGGLFDGIDFSNPEQLAELIQAIVDSIESLGEVTDGMVSEFVPFIKKIGEAIESFNDLEGSSKEAIGAVLGIGKIADTLLPLFDTLGTAISTLGTAMSALASAHIVKMITGFGSIPNAATTATGALGTLGKAVGALGAAALAFQTGSLIGDWINRNFGDNIRPASDAILGFADDLLDFSGKTEAFNKKVDELEAGYKALGQTFDRETVNIDNIGEKWGELTRAQYEAEQGAKDLSEEIDGTSEAVEDLSAPLEKVVVASGELGVGVKGSVQSVDDFKDAVKDAGKESDAASLMIEMLSAENAELADSLEYARQNTENLAEEQKEAQRQIEESEKRTQELKLALLDYSSEIYKTSVELEIEKARLDMERFTASLESLAGTVVSSGDLISDLFSTLAGGDLSKKERDEALKVIQQEAKLRKEVIEKQLELADAELESIKLKNELLASGDSTIKLQADGLEPEIEAFMFKILEKIQLRASQEQAQFLIGAIG